MSGLARGWGKVILALALLTLAPAASAQPANPFADWVAVVAAGDYRAHSGQPAKVFDNARQDLSKALVGMGFTQEHIAQFSVRPQLFAEVPFSVDPPSGLFRELKRLTDASPGGCLIYLTSHGAPEGILYGKGLLNPAALDGILDRTCGERPTVVIISACFSGVFVPVLSAPNRMIVTAARPDRTSFGCGEEETYTYFDGCVLQSLPAASRFDELAEAARACVARRETETGMTPPSEPQVSIGKSIAALLPRLTLTARPRASDSPGE